MSLDTIHGPETIPQVLAKEGAPMLTITSAAADRIRFLLNQKAPKPEALMVSLKTKGCSGLSYDLQYLDKLSDRPKYADMITQHDVTVVIDPKVALYIVGSIMDYKESSIASGFDFINPNETGRCGCGESFSVKPK